MRTSMRRVVETLLLPFWWRVRHLPRRPRMYWSSTLRKPLNLGWRTIPLYRLAALDVSISEVRLEQAEAAI